MRSADASVSYRLAVVVVHERAARHPRDGVRAIHRSCPPREDDKLGLSSVLGWSGSGGVSQPSSFLFSLLFLARANFSRRCYGSQLAALRSRVPACAFFSPADNNSFSCIFPYGRAEARGICKVETGEGGRERERDGEKGRERGGARLSLSSRAEKQTERQRMNLLRAHTRSHARTRSLTRTLSTFHSPPRVRAWL